MQASLLTSATNGQSLDSCLFSHFTWKCPGKEGHTQSKCIVCINWQTR